jgi:hypothetical protein
MKQHALKTYEEVEKYLQFFIWTLDEDDLLHAKPLYPGRNCPMTQFHKRLGEPQSGFRLYDEGENLFSPPGIKTRFFCRQAHRLVTNGLTYKYSGF